MPPAGGQCPPQTVLPSDGSPHGDPQDTHSSLPRRLEIHFLQSPPFCTWLECITERTENATFMTVNL